MGAVCTGMHLIRSRVLAATAFVTAACAFACSSAPPDGTLAGEINGNDPASSGSTVPKKTTSTGGSTSNTGSTGSTGNTGGTPTPTPTPTADAGVTPVGTGQCASSADFDTCLDCCDPQNALEVDNAAFGQCVCQSPGVCAAQCATSFCAGLDPTAACEQCLDAATQCDQTADAACNANAGCAAALACVTSSGCDAKP